MMHKYSFISRDVLGIFRTGYSVSTVGSGVGSPEPKGPQGIIDDNRFAKSTWGVGGGSKENKKNIFLYWEVVLY